MLAAGDRSVAASGPPEFSADVRPGPGSDPEYVTEVGGNVFLGAREPEHGEELWKSDGTFTGTVLVKDIRPGPGGSPPSDGTVMVADLNPTGSSNPTDLVEIGGLLAFAADDGIHGKEIWTYVPDRPIAGRPDFTTSAEVAPHYRSMASTTPHAGVIRPTWSMQRLRLAH